MFGTVGSFCDSVFVFVVCVCVCVFREGKGKGKGKGKGMNMMYERPLLRRGSLHLELYIVENSSVRKKGRDGDWGVCVEGGVRQTNENELVCILQLEVGHCCSAAALHCTALHKIDFSFLSFFFSFFITCRAVVLTLSLPFYDFE